MIGKGRKRFFCVGSDLEQSVLLHIAESLKTDYGKIVFFCFGVRKRYLTPFTIVRGKLRKGVYHETKKTLGYVEF